MADYKELLRKAIEALPENNGAARRAVYEKARAALVGQLRAINPPLAARDITTHRLQLEDCIRQVEQEASEAVIAGLGMQEPPPPPPPVFFENKAPQVAAKQQAVAKQQPGPAKAPARGQVVALSRDAAKGPVGREAPKAVPMESGSIEDIIAAADKDARGDDGRGPGRGSDRSLDEGRGGRSTSRTAQPIRPAARQAPPPPVVEDDEEEVAEPAFVPPQRQGPGRQLPSIVARAEAVRSKAQNGAFTLPVEAAPVEPTRRGPSFEPRRDAAVARGQVMARQSEPMDYFDDVDVPAAMSSVREVEVEHVPVDPQGAIDRAIATLDREARGENDEDESEFLDPATVPQEDYEEEEAPVRPAKAKKGLMGGMFGGAGGAAAKGRVEPQIERAAKAEPAPAPTQRILAEPPVQRPAPKAGKAAKAEAPPKPEKPAKVAKGKAGRKDVAAAMRARGEPRRGGASAVTVFLLVFLVLLGGAGGAGYWAWQEGYVDLDSLFGAGGTTEVAVATPQPAITPSTTPSNAVTGPGNTATATAPATPTGELREERLEPAPAVPAPLALVPPSAAAAAPGAGTPRTEERLPDASQSPSQAATAIAGIDPATTAGSQSLLLEAADAGQTGAIPFSGTVDWTRGQDETGQPTLVGEASIPARNLGVDILIRKNSDPSLPASHLMEINFVVPETFIGGSIAGLPGVLLKNEELVQGVPLVGASARVVGNTFLFALSASPQDTANNSTLLTSRRWIDLAVIYATGKRAILTLEKDDAAVALFNDVFQSWTQTAATR
jgi:hypothetical protein